MAGSGLGVVVALTPEMLVVVAIVLAALVLFPTEPVPVDIVGIGVMVALILVGPVAELLAAAAPLDGITLEQDFSGFINNTAAVAILLPMVTDLAHDGRTSPSKLLMALSFASMLGGTLTLIGTSTNVLASEPAARSCWAARSACSSSRSSGRSSRSSAPPTC